MTPIHKSVSVPLRPTDAFSLFLKNMQVWWPTRKFSVSGKDATQPKLEVLPRKNGTITEITADGKRILWGTFLGWEDGAYASFTWHPGSGPQNATVVCVTFRPTKDGCRVDLTHGGFEILGDTADAVSKTYVSGWKMVLGSYCAAATSNKVFA